MCTVSVVHDHFMGRFLEPFKLADVTDVPPLGVQITVPLSPTPGSIIPWEEIFALRQLISDFREAVEAAKKVDVLTKQPDCVDPQKSKLEIRVAELERRLDKLSGI